MQRGSVSDRARRRRAHERIAAYIEANFASVRAAAEALKVPHNSLWRAASGLNARGPSADVAMVLAAHSGRPTGYWLGEEEG